MSHLHEQPNDEQQQSCLTFPPVGAVVLSGLHDEDPLVGDVDRFVHPDETRTDMQIAHDEGVANRLHMSGDDGADEYWADYDEYHGTVNGGEDPLAIVNEGETEAKIEMHPAYDNQVYITTPRGRRMQVNTASVKEFQDEGLPLQEIGRRFDLRQDETDKEIAEYREKQRSMRRYDEEGHDLDEENEDPLAGDVDRWVDPDGTN